MKLHAWVAPALERIFPLSPIGKGRSLALHCARGEQAALQVGFRLPHYSWPKVVSLSAKAPDDLLVTIRRQGLAPMPQYNSNTEIVTAEDRDGEGLIPGFVPDILLPQTSGRFASEQNHAFWISVLVPADAQPGKRAIELTLQVEEGPAVSLKATLHVAEFTLARRTGFPITHWFYADALLDWYKLEMWEENFWTICEKYMANYAGHGLDTIYVPAFTPPLDGVKRPSQLVRVRKLGGGKYQFDFAQVRRWIRLAQKCGITHFEWVHFFTQWGAKFAIRIYEEYGHDERRLLWKPETPATSPVYRKFLAQFLPQLHRFLQQEGILENSFFHVSDEPHGDHVHAYRACRELLRELAPWMKVMDAISDIQFGREKLNDMPIPVITAATDFLKEGIPSWCYYCCGPRGTALNRLLDTPLPKIRMNGWLFYRFRQLGFLHWGYNYWYLRQSRQLIDPFHTNDGNHWPGWAHGDPFVVYPGADGPIDSIRWEVFFHSLQDYQLLQTAGCDPDSALLAPLHDFSDFPKNQAWIDAARRKLLRTRI